ncbi:MAG: hypothetical protein FRX49_07702 [Trebouxia sp. A1-2]|nr:MAG: hypothetical protein FRX49_07702 [Trebouxia sp. A1-2]
MGTLGAMTLGDLVLDEANKSGGAAGTSSVPGEAAHIQGVNIGSLVVSTINHLMAFSPIQDQLPAACTVKVCLRLFNNPFIQPLDPHRAPKALIAAADASWHGTAWHGTARHGTAQPSSAQLSPTQQSGRHNMYIRFSEEPIY